MIRPIYKVLPILRVNALRITQLAEDASAADKESFDALTNLNTQMTNAWSDCKSDSTSQGEISRPQIQVRGG